MKLLLDTNALIDLVACRAPFDADIRKLCIAASFGDVQLWASTQSFADAYYVLRRSASESAVKQALLATLEFILPCGTHAADVEPALRSDWHDIEDYLIAFSSRHIRADRLITRDGEMMQRSPIEAMDAGTFLRSMEAERGLVYDEIAL